MGTDTERWEQYDYERPAKLTRDNLRHLTAVHEEFTRRLSPQWNDTLRTPVQVEARGIRQITFGDLVRALPNPNALLLVEVAPLPGTVIIETTISFSYRLMDRLLGGVGNAQPPQRPTDLDAHLVNQALQPAAEALAGALSTLRDVSIRTVGIEFNPQMLQVAQPGETFASAETEVSLERSRPSHGVLSVNYPYELLQPLLTDTSDRHGGDRPPDKRLEPAVHSLDCEIAATLAPTSVATGQILRLQPGDVLRTDHRVDQPAQLRSGGAVVATGSLGRRGSRRAVRLEGFPTKTSDPSVTNAEE